MTRILADLSDEDIKWLDARALEEGKSRASVLREAVAAYKAQMSANDIGWIDQGFGLWARRGIAARPNEHDVRRQAEWTRPWDQDYEAVCAAVPEAFDDGDDKERAHYLALMAAAKARQAKSAE
jgi:hypothetical protein